MNASGKLRVIKGIHTVIWLFFVFIIGYVLYCGMVNRVTAYTWAAIAVVIGEGVVLLIFKMVCPLTVLAQKYSNSQKDNFDIYLPNWLAKYNKTIYTSILGVIILILVYKLIKN